MQNNRYWIGVASRDHVMNAVQGGVETPIQPLISQLSFTKSTKYWGYSFRLGHLEISEKDFKLIAEKMVYEKGD